MNRILRNEFNIHITPNLEKGVNKMCNLSEGIYQQGIQQGYERGVNEMRHLSDGIYQQGIQQGYEQGRSAMLADIESRAKKMFHSGLSMEQVMEFTGLPLERLQEIREAR